MHQICSGHIAPLFFITLSVTFVNRIMVGNLFSNLLCKDESVRDFEWNLCDYKGIIV